MIGVTERSFVPSETKTFSRRWATDSKSRRPYQRTKMKSRCGRMVDEEANNGHYDELTSLIGIRSPVCGGSCPGAYGDHLIVSDGKEWHYSEALHESNYPAVRVEFGGVIRSSEVDDARKYWTVYSTALAAIKRAA